MGLGIAKMTSRQEAEAQAVKATDGLGLKTAADLRAMSAEDALTKLPRSGMIADGWIVPEDLSKTFADGPAEQKSTCWSVRTAPKGTSSAPRAPA